MTSDNIFQQLFEQVLSANSLFAASLLRMQSALTAEHPGSLKRQSEIALATNHLMNTLGEDSSFLGVAYKRIFMQFLRDQKYYIKHAQYPAMEQTICEVKNAVYHNPEFMNIYMIALLFTYSMWPNKYNLMSYVLDSFLRNLPNDCRLLDIGPGHGFFMAKALQGNRRTAMGVDLSQSSLSLTECMLDFYGIESGRRELIAGDVQNLDSGCKFDAILCSEVVEHVENPGAFLQMLKLRLNQGGKILLTTALNTAAVDHIQLFDSQLPVRKLITDNGFSYTDETVYPEFNHTGCTTPQQIKNNLICAAYSAILTY